MRAGIFTFSRSFLSLAMMLSAVTVGVEAVPSTQPSTQPTSRPVRPSHLKENLEGMHQVFGILSPRLGLSSEQDAKVAEIEKALAGKGKADPMMSEDGVGFTEETLAQYRTVLTSAQQAQFDPIQAAIMRNVRNAYTQANLRSIGQGILLYANDNNGKTPPDLGKLIAEDYSVGRVMLLGGSKVKLPAEADLKKLAQWANDHTDFVYLGAGQKWNDLPASGVMVYIKPELAKDGQLMLFNDGHVALVPEPVAAQAIAELKAGQNPPPSLHGK